MRRTRAEETTLVFLSLVISLIYLSTAAAEQNNVEEEVEKDVFDDDSYIDPKEDAWYMVLVLSLLFGLFITLFGAFVGYFSMLEDSLMGLYMREGEPIFAKVVSSEFARGGGQVAIFTKQRDNPEYICFCEYDRNTEGYTARIRKQCKAKASDFSSSPRPGTEGMLLSIKMATARQQQQQQQQVVGGDDDMFVEFSNPEDVCCNMDDDMWRSVGAAADREYLELLILPNHERSAYPRKSVERACSTKYRLLTIGLVVCDLALAAFCTLWATNDVLGLEEDRRIIGWYAIAAFLVLIVLEVPMIHYCCHDMFLEALREEYLDNGEYVPLQDDASSLSSGSDMYLSMAWQSKLFT